MCVCVRENGLFECMHFPVFALWIRVFVKGRKREAFKCWKESCLCCFRFVCLRFVGKGRVIVLGE